MFFSSWDGIIRILLTGVLAYVALIVWLRLSGKRSLSKWNAFDFVVTVALGSTLASVVTSKDLVLLEGIAALLLLITLQFIITWLSVRVDWIQNLIKAKPTLLFDRGNFLPEEMRRQRVSEAEIRMAIRNNGAAAIEDIEAVVLETDGSFSVIQKSSTGSRTAFKDVE